MSKNTKMQTYNCFREWLASMKIKYKKKDKYDYIFFISPAKIGVKWRISINYFNVFRVFCPIENELIIS